jgi:hypothetical protein
MIQAFPDFRVLELSKSNLNIKYENDKRVLIGHINNPTEFDLITSLKNLSKINCIRWASGGGVYLINKRWIPLIQRSNDSTTNPGKITIASGRSDNIEEILDPRLIIRELFEEICLSIDKKILIPIFQKNYFFNNLKIRNYILDNNCINQTNLQEIGINSSLNESLYKDRLRIYLENSQIQESDVLFHIANNGIEINFMHVVELEINTLDHLHLHDTEKIITMNGFKMLKRLICIYDLRDEVMYKLPDGYFENREKFSDWHLTEHADYLLKKIEEYLS